jgi:hypothetical protein
MSIRFIPWAALHCWCASGRVESELEIAGR